MTLRKNFTAFIAISILGTIGHFIYELTGENQIIGFFFPVNESTWEHLKLIFFPTILYSVFEYFTLNKKYENYISAIVASAIWGMFSVVILFYTQKGILGYSIEWLNILIYYISIVFMIYKKNKHLKSGKFTLKISQSVFTIIGFVISILFIYFTKNPPSLGVFIPL